MLNKYKKLSNSLLVGLERLLNRRLVKADDDRAVNVNYRHAHLSCFFHHLVSGFLIRCDIDVSEHDSFLLQELLDLMAPGAGRSGVDGDGHVQNVEKWVY